MSWRIEWRKKLKEFDPEDYRTVNNQVYNEEFPVNVTEKGFMNIIMNRERRIIDELRKFEWNSLLDIGCQNGRQLVQMKAAFPDKRLLGIDISNDALEVAKRILPSTTFIECPAEEMPFDDGCFDVVHASEILEHVFDVDDVLREIYRVLKLNGVMLGTIPIERHHDGGCHLRYYDHGSLSSQLSRHFTVEMIEKIGAVYPDEEATVFFFKCKNNREYGVVLKK